MLRKFTCQVENLNSVCVTSVTSLFERTVSTVEECLGSKAFKPKTSLNAGVYDSVMLAVAKRLLKGGIKDKAKMASQYQKLLKNPDYMSATDVSMADVTKVRTRVALATQAFAAVR